MKIKNQGFDHVEFVVNDILKSGLVYERMGFEKIGMRSQPEKGLKSALYAQGYARVMLTQPDGSLTGEAQIQTKFLRTQGEGVTVLGVEVDDAAAAYEETLSRGARPALAPVRHESPEGSVIRAEIYTPAQVRYAFIERKAPGGPAEPALFDQDLIVSRLESPTPFNIKLIDHLTNNIGMGETATWVDFYTRVMGFQVVRHFDIRTGRTGLTSEVVQSPCGKIKVPINEATEKESQVQEFVDRLKGPGVQHLAFLTTDIIPTVKSLRGRDFEFLNVPHTYYETVPTRVPGVTESLEILEELGILLDGEKEGYLLQLFTAEVLGPFFFEFIQRKGNQGFGEGNFRALFEAIERDQIRRGVLKA